MRALERLNSYLKRNITNPTGKEPALQALIETGHAVMGTEGEWYTCGAGSCEI